MRLRTTITIETTTVVTVHTGAAQRAWCPQCAADADMVPLGAVTGLPGPGGLALDQWVHACRIHLTRAANGVARVCLTSLLAGIGYTQPGDASASSGLPSGSPAASLGQEKTR